MDLFFKTFLSVLLYFLKMFISCRSVYIYVLKKSFKRWYFSLDSPSQDKCMLMQITFFNFDSFLIIIGNLLLFFFHSFDSKFNFTLFVWSALLQYYNTNTTVYYLIFTPKTHQTAKYTCMSCFMINIL